MFDNEKIRNEDYMGMVSWSKSYNASPRNLFGTEIKTDNPITLRINKVEETRNLSRNWYHSLGQIVEIEMSPIQWAEFLTSGNSSGVPCTIKYIGGQKMSDPKETEIFNDYNEEVEEHFDKFKDIENIVKDAIDSKKPMGRRELIMNITDLIDEELEESIKEFGEYDLLVKMSRNIMKYFGYKVLAEINRLNFTAFTVIDDNDLSKQGYGNMLLNYLVDKDDEVYGKIHFTEYKAWNKVSERNPKIHDELVIVKCGDGTLNFAKYGEDGYWYNQKEQIICNVAEWKSLTSDTDL